jgi:hypothetical protein
MGHWDAVVSDFQGVDVNRVVRNGIDIMEREPDAWRAKILILAAAYPGVDWSQVAPPYCPETPTGSLLARGANEAFCMHQVSQGVHEVSAGHTCSDSRTSAGQLRVEGSAPVQFFTEYPSLCYVPNATLARAVNDWADQLIGAAPCSLDF